MKWVIRGGRPLSGPIKLPGDKSITHRALILGALASGETRITGGSLSDDCRSTIACLEALGAVCRVSGDDRITVCGAGGRFSPNVKLDCGNSGTTMRLFAGLLAGLPLTATLDGDESLRSRPMARIAEPLRAMGATVMTAPGGRRR